MCFLFCFFFFVLQKKKHSGQETLAFVSFRMTPRCSAPPFPGRLQLLVCCPSQCISVWHHPHDVAFARAPVFSMVPNHLEKMLPIAVTHCYRRYKWVLITCVNNKAEAKRFFYFYVRVRAVNMNEVLIPVFEETRLSNWTSEWNVSRIWQNIQI